MTFFDTHAHLNDEQLCNRIDSVLVNCKNAAVDGIVCIGIDAASSQLAVDIAAANTIVFAAVGIQPNYVSQVTDADWDLIRQLAKHEKVVAIGETGLDRYWDFSPFDLQLDFFHQHLELSFELDLPFVIHMRDCGDDIVDVLFEYESRFPLRGVMHSFTGDWPQAVKCLQAGLHISFAGMVTYKKSDPLRDIARQVPLNRLLIETDAPYLSPHPKRGQRPNEPALVIHTAECLAKLFEMSAEKFGLETSRNARELFRIDG